MKVRLDELYKMTAAIYQDANLARSREATFLHFVEVCGMLTLLDRKKKRDKVDIPGALCKALGWYFPLLAKMGVASVERLIFAKYPYACPYCRKAPHVEKECKLVKGADQTVSHEELRQVRVDHADMVPSTLNEWQLMFDAIYPRDLNTAGAFSTVALLEELGELAEAIRVFDRYPHYFFGEAADAFSYIMGMANEYAITEEGQGFNFQEEFLARYPGMCINCGSRSCICPPVPDATIGRMAKEMEIDVSTSIADINLFAAEGERIAAEVFDRIGQDIQIGKHLPYDRGELNAAMTQLCYRLANAIQDKDADTADKLRSQAGALTTIRKKRGTAERTGEPFELLNLLRNAWSLVDGEMQTEIREEGGSVAELTHIFDLRILVVTSNPSGTNDLALRLDKELKIIKNAFKAVGLNEKEVVSHISAASIDDLLAELRDYQFDIVHFSGHAHDLGLSFMTEDGDEDELGYDALEPIFKKHDRIKCVVLNACSTMNGISVAFAPLVIGMVVDIDDDDALAFSTGFYGALAAKRTPDEAFEQGVLNIAAKGGDQNAVAKLVLAKK